MYELCRKFCGSQTFWEIGIDNLYSKFGVQSEIKEFRRKLKELVAQQSIPDYYLEYKTKKETGTVEKLLVYIDKSAHLKKLVADENNPT
jgi:hypothetical protein